MKYRPKKRRTRSAPRTFARSERIAAMIFLFVVPRMTESAARHGIPSPFRICRQKSLHSQKRDTALISCPGTSSRRAFVCRTQGLGASPEPLRNIFDTTASAVRSPSFKISTRALFAHTASTDLPAQHRLHPVTCVSPAWRHNAYPSPFHHRATAGFPPSDVSRRGCFSSLPDRFTWAAQRLPLCTGTQKTAAALLRGSPMGYREQIRSGPVHPPEIFDLGYWRAFSPLLRFSTDFVVAAPSVLNLDETPPSLSPTILRNCWCTELICLV